MLVSNVLFGVLIRVLALVIGKGGRIVCLVNLPLISRRRDVLRVVHMVV